MARNYSKENFFTKAMRSIRNFILLTFMCIYFSLGVNGSYDGTRPLEYFSKVSESWVKKTVETVGSGVGTVIKAMK